MEWPCRYGARLAEHASNNKAGETLRGVWVMLASAGQVAWGGAMAYIGGMTVRPIPILMALAATLVPTAGSAAARDIGVLPQGRYQCALPGDAQGRAYVPVPDLSFRITSASRYVHKSGKGIYLLEGDTLVFTRGPLKDMRLRRVSGGLLQQVKSDGTLGRVRCNRATR